MNTIRRFWAIEDKGEEARAGWMAWYVIPRRPYVFSQPLIGWALVTRDNADQIVGIVANGAEIIEADRPSDGERFAMYMQRGSWTQEQIDKAEKDLYSMGQRLEAYEQETRRNASKVGERGVLPTSRKDGTTEVYQKSIRALQDEVEGGGQGSGTDTPQEPPIDVEE